MKKDAFSIPDEEPHAPPRLCEHEGCLLEGEFPAPKSRHNLREYRYFCLDHVREYNKKWDFFKGYSQDEIYNQMKYDTAWERPTWPPGAQIKLEEKLHDFLRKFTKDNKSSTAAPKTPLSREAQALDTLGLPPNADLKTIKSKYRELVKRWHPDKNPNNPKAADRFKIISEAYMIIQSFWQGKR
jgi:hypothetical protein